MGFNFTVIDQDDGTNYETWMGITDGLFGGRDASKYQDLNFASAESVLAASQKIPEPKSIFASNVFLSNETTVFNSFVVVSDEKILPARLNVLFNGKKKFSYDLKKGFNNFTSRLHADSIAPGAYEIVTNVEKNGKSLFQTRERIAVLSRDYLASLTSGVEKKQKALEGKIAKIRASGTEPDYLKACSAMIRYFVDFARYDIDAKNVLRGHLPFKVDRTYSFYIYDRMFKNLT